MSIALVILFCFLMIAAAVQDARSYTISNWISVSVFVVGIAGVLTQASPGDWWQHAASFGLTFSIGILLFTRQWLGGGDVKLISAAAIWFDLQNLASLILLMLVLGGLLAFGMIASRMVLKGGLAKRGLRHLRQSSIPYGVPIALASISLALIGATAAGNPGLIN